LCVCVCVWGKYIFFCPWVLSEFPNFKIISKKKKYSLLSSTQYELVWSHAYFRQHQDLLVPVKCHNHESCINYNYFLDLLLFSGAFGKLQKAYIKFVVSGLSSSRLPVCPPARTEQLRSNWTNRHEILYFRVFQNFF
jgi:hypothetical protein